MPKCWSIVPGVRTDPLGRYRHRCRADVRSTLPVESQAGEDASSARVELEASERVSHLLADERVGVFRQLGDFVRDRFRELRFGEALRDTP